jgi:hypothetical protein
MSTPNLYQVHLAAQQRQRLGDLTHNGHAPAKKILHARILLLADKDHPAGRYTDGHIAAALGLHVNSVARIRKLFALHGEQPALDRKPREAPPVPAKVGGAVEAHLVAICCPPAPAGQARWALSLLAGELTRRGLVSSICKETVRQALKKTSCSPGASSAGASRRRTGPAS